MIIILCGNIQNYHQNPNHDVEHYGRPYCTYGNRNYEVGIVHRINAAFKCSSCASRQMYFWCDTPTHMFTAAADTVQPTINQVVMVSITVYIY